MRITDVHSERGPLRGPQEMAEMRITKSFLKQLEADRPKAERIIFDDEVRGFGIRARPDGVPLYIFRYKLGRRRFRISLGPAHELPPEKAREIARGYRVSIREGRDPLDERRQMRAMPLLRDLAERYMQEHAIPHKKPGSIKNDRGLWDNHILPMLGDRRVDRIDEADVLALKTKHAKRHPRANACLALLSKALNLAETWKYRPIRSNPCHLVKKFPPRKRERIMSPEEMEAFGAALEFHEQRCPQVVTLLRVLLMTGARLNEIMRAKRSQLDVARRILILPDSKTGQGLIELPEAALKILAAQPDGEWLIPGPMPGHPVRSPWNAFRRICKTAGIDGLRIHDLRHCFGSYSHRAGISQKMIASLLRHKQLVTTERYIQGFDSERRKAADLTAEALKALLRPAAAKSIKDTRGVA